VELGEDEKKCALTHIAKDDIHRSDGVPQKKARVDKLMRDLAAVATDPSQSKTRQTG
jgi:hypothetical protein